MGVVVHGEVRQPGSGVGVHHDLVPPLDVQDDVLPGHGVLMVVLVVLVKDGSDLLSVLPDAEQRLLVVVGGDVEHKEVGATGGTGEDASVHVKAAPIVAVSAVEGEVLLAAAIVGLASVGVEVNAQGLARQGSEVGVLLHHLGLQVADVVNPLLVLGVCPGCQLRDGVLPVSDLLVDSVAQRLVLGVPGGGLGVSSGVQGGNVSLGKIVVGTTENICKIRKNLPCGRHSRSWQSSRG